MSHPRVVNVRARGAWDVYIGRGPCPRRGDAGRTLFGNPYSVERHGLQAMALYLNHVAWAWNGSLGFRQAVEGLAGQVLGCWCAPRLCHGEVLARLADGEPLEAIRADVLAQVEALRARKAPAGPGPLFGAP